MLLEAARTHHLDLAESWMIGDSEHDVEAGKSAGCRTVQLIDGSKSPIDGDVVASSLLNAVLKLLEVQTSLFATTAVEFG